MATFTSQPGVAADYLEPGLAPAVAPPPPPLVTPTLRTGGVIVRTQHVVVG